MLKSLVIFFFILSSFCAFGQIQPIPKAEETHKVNTNLKGDGEYSMFKNLKHPLAITGGVFVLGGAATYVAGSQHNNYQPENTAQFIGIGVFVAGAVLFTIFSTERNKNTPKRKKIKKKYNASDWQAQ